MSKNAYKVRINSNEEGSLVVNTIYYWMVAVTALAMVEYAASANGDFVEVWLDTPEEEPTIHKFYINQKLQHVLQVML